jgi:hypothetical protein
METPAGPASSSDAKNVDRRMSLGKYVKRMSSVFKREKSAEKGSKSPAAAPHAPSTSQVEGKPHEETTKEHATKEEVAPTA